VAWGVRVPRSLSCDLATAGFGLSIGHCAPLATAWQTPDVGPNRVCAIQDATWQIVQKPTGPVVLATDRCYRRDEGVAVPRTLPNTLHLINGRFRRLEP